jgi:hypothetical protein
MKFSLLFAILALVLLSLRSGYDRMHFILCNRNPYP